MGEISRRDFIKLSTASSVYLAIGFSSSEFGISEAIADDKNALNSNESFSGTWIKIDQNNICTITIPETEMGQGIYTGLSTLIADELDMEWQAVNVVRASAASKYGNQLTGGSYSIRKRWGQFREIAALTRQMFIESAANSWGVSADNCITKNATVFDKTSDRKIKYSALIERVNKKSLPENALLKTSEEFNLIGKNTRRVDALNKVNGEAIFGIDVQLPNMLIATTVHAPIFGATIGKINKDKALNVAGVVKIVKIENAVAVIAKDTWSAFKAAKLLNIDWQFSGKKINSDDIKLSMQQALEKDAAVVIESGNMNVAGDIISANYIAPFQAHATTEPMNCSVHIHDGVCEVWAPTQAPTKAKKMAQKYYYSLTDRLWKKAKKLLKANNVDDVVVHTTYVGGGFGRRLQQDFVAEAVQIATQVSQPIKLIWRREEDMQHDFYRPIALSKLQAKVNAEGYPVSLNHHIISPSLRESLSPGSLKRNKQIDKVAIEGAANIPYDIPNHKISYSAISSPVPLGYWRSVGSSINAYHLECFFDELAADKNIDAFKYRQKLLGNSPRLLETLNRVAEISKWKTDPNVYYGIASHSSYGSHVSQVVKLIKQNQRFIIEHVYCVIDCGIAINPNIIKAQLEGSIIYGISSIKSEITISDGKVDQSNFHDFPLLKFKNSPKITCEIIDSFESPGGVGEPAVPPAIPAVLNAYYAATGERVRSLPIKSSKLVL